MENLITILLGDGIYPFPLDKIENYTRYYESTHINIVITKTNISFTAGPQLHSHDSYEFLIPFKPMPFIGCEGAIFFVPQYMVFPFNPRQEHGPQGDMVNSLFAAVHIESDFMRKVVQDTYAESDFVFINQPIALSNELKVLIENFTDEAVKSEVGDKLVMECLSTQIAVQLIRDFKATHLGSDAGSKNIKTNLASAIDIFYDKYSCGGYSTQFAANQAHLSKYYFIRAFKNETGKTPYNFLLDMKINKAKELLKEGKHTITEVYFLCGFVNHSHFTTTFKKKVGMSPSMFRKVHSLG